MIAVVTLTLHERTRQLWWTAAGLILLVVMIGALWPSYREIDISEIYGALPEGMQAMFGVEDTTFTGAAFVNSELLSFMLPIVLVGIGIAAANGVVSGDETSGRMDVLLATGLRRHELLLGRALGIMLELLVLCVVTGIMLAGCDLAFDLDLDVGVIAAAMTMAWLLAMTSTSLALAVAACLRHGPAVGVAAAVTLASWITNSLGQVVSSLEDAARMTTFHAYGEGPPIMEGLEPLAAARLAIEVVVLLGIAVLGFRRRDLG